MSNSRVISPGEKVATMGSCFAQHLARQIQAAGLNYFVAEQAPAHLTNAESIASNYGTFSARYGNIYTVKQAVQLYDRAFGEFEPTESTWEWNGGFVDPFRPRIDLLPKSSTSEIHASRIEHLSEVRRVFKEADWIVFTLGLTEAWRSKEDGSVYPLAPGVAGGNFDSDRHEFVNFTASEVRNDLAALWQRIRTSNPNVKLLLTVSPVALVATYEPRHVLQSTIVSKSILRVAADELERLHPDIIYFPSYEIITSPAAGGLYYHDDLREVTSTGVKQVMRVFRRHFIDGPDKIRDTAQTSTALSLSTMSGIVCDEGVIEEALQQAGFR